jgi:acetoin utilization protein AcuB
MLVKNWMSTDVIEVDADSSMQDAFRLLKEHRIRMLPVVSESRLVGVVTDRDLKRASASDATSLDIHELLYLIARIKVDAIMTRNPITVLPEMTIEETAQILMENKISGAPVVDGRGKVAGIITQTDLFRVLISLTGVSNQGVQFALQAEDRSGSIKELADVVRKFGGRLISILTSYDQVPEGYRKVYIRAIGLQRHQTETIVAELGEVAMPLYFVDHRENRREIY